MAQPVGHGLEQGLTVVTVVTGKQGRGGQLAVTMSRMTQSGVMQNVDVERVLVTKGHGGRMVSVTVEQ